MWCLYGPGGASLQLRALEHCQRLVDTAPTPNRAHRTLVAEMDSRFCPGWGEAALEQLVSERSIVRRSCKGGRGSVLV
jgi:hypothetical protein